MIHEIAHITVKPGREADFEQGVQQAKALFQRARGCRSMALQRGIEHPQQYRLLIEWETLEDHTVHFRGSADFTAWRSLVGDCFAEPPQVVHTATVLTAF